MIHALPHPSAGARARRLLALALLAACALGLLQASRAEALGYTVDACRNDSFSARSNKSWVPFNDVPDRFVLYADCPASRSGYSSLKVRMVAGSSGMAQKGGGAGWQFTAPPGLELVTAGFDDWYGTAASANGWHVGERTPWASVSTGCQTTSTATRCTTGARRTTDTTAVAPLNASPLPPADPPPAYNRVTFGITCEPPVGYSGCGVPTNAGAEASLEVYRATVTLREIDPQPPEIDATVSGGEWVRSVHVFADARDFTGIASAYAVADPDAGYPYSTTIDNQCDWTAVFPCRNFNRGGMYIRDLADGVYRIQVRARDATGYLGFSKPITVTVDNVPPPPPTRIAPTAGSQWQGSPTPTVSWTLPAESRASPVVAADYQVCRGNEWCGYRERADSTTSTEVILPDQGEYQVKVWLTDGAGNVSESNAATTTVRYAATAPATPLALRPSTTAEWVNDPVVRLLWELPTVAGAPVTGAQVRRCSADVSVCDAPAAATSATSATVTLPADGDHWLEVWLANAAGLSDVATRTRTLVQLDRTPPARPAGLAVATSPGSASATVSWAAPYADRAPYDHTRWALCSASGGGCVGSGQTSQRSLTVTAPSTGDWRLTVTHVDRAGNLSTPADVTWTYAPLAPLAAPEAPFGDPGALFTGPSAPAARAATGLSTRLARAPHGSVRVTVTAARTLAARTRVTLRCSVGRTTRVVRRIGSLRGGRLVLTVPLPRGTSAVAASVSTPATATHRAGRAAGRLRLAR